jgi:hypothetical protein
MKGSNYGFLIINMIAKIPTTAKSLNKSQKELHLSDVSDNNKKCNHPKIQIWQYKQHWLCCKCWHQEQGKYIDSIFA